MPAVYIGQDEHFLKTGLEVIITNRFIFESSPKEFITLQNASNRNEVCTIEKKDTWRLEDKERITCDLIQFFSYTDCISQSVVDISSYFLHNSSKHVQKLLEWHQERYSNVGYKVLPNVETNPTQAYSYYSDKFPWMLDNYVPSLDQE